MGIVTRIIAGFAGSLRLTVPNTGTRPTSDRVREAIFSALESRDAIDGCRALDLYAGTGSLGLEAVSRGAVHATLVDRSPQGAKACRANAALVQKQHREPLDIVVSSQPVQAFLASAVQTWDLVFIDPPYELGGVELVHNLSALVPRLTADALVVIERSSRDPEPAWPAGLELEKKKVYGDTVLYWVVASSTAPRVE